MRIVNVITDSTTLTGQTLKLLDAHGIQYTATRVTSPGAMDAVAGHGYKTTPVVIIKHENRNVTFNGYRPDLIIQHLVRGQA